MSDYVTLDSDKMLLLQLGKSYEFEDFLGCKTRAKVVSKETRRKGCTSYFIIWPNPNCIHPYGRYMWDESAANQNRTISLHSHAVRCCREIPDVFKEFQMEYKLKESCLKCFYWTGKGGKGRAYKCYCGDCPAKMRDNLNKQGVPKKNVRKRSLGK